MRIKIRQAAALVLEAIPDLTTVKIGRRHKIADKHLPAALIYTDTEESELVSLSPVTNQNTVDLVVDCYVRPVGSTAGEDDLDAIIDQVDAALLPAIREIDPEIDIAIRSIATSADSADVADSICGRRTYSVTYYTLEP